MPLQRCTSDGRPGWKYGDAGACYPYTAGDAASEANAKKRAVQQALAIGGGKAPTDLSDVSDEDVLLLAEGDLPDGVEACTMGGNKGFRGKGGPNSACHLHDGTPGSMASAMRKAAKDVGTANAPPKYGDRALGALETEDMRGVPIMAAGGPYFGTGSPPEGDFFNDDDLHEIAGQTAAVADEVRIPVKLGHSRGQKLLKNSGLFTDEMPAAGWVNASNLRVANGQLIGDLMAVPKKLAELIRVGGFRTRSVELSRVKSQKQNGKEYGSVITGLALLGAKAPAIRTLDDIVALYADADPVSRFSDGLEATPAIVYVSHFTEAAEETDPSDDTSGMPTDTAPAALNDEQIEKLATAFGIAEDDAAKRREQVLAKFAEHAPKSETSPDPTPPAPSPDPVPPTPNPAPEPQTVSLSQQELAVLKEQAARGDKAFAEARDRRIRATVELAARQGRIKPADVATWVSFAERDEEFAISQLAAMPVNMRLVTTYGQDGDGNASAADKTENDVYAAYAAQTGVRRHVTQTAGGSQS